MANVLDRDTQVAVISALAEGSGIRQIERITGVHRDTIMRLGHIPPITSAVLAVRAAIVQEFRSLEPTEES